MASRSVVPGSNGANKIAKITIHINGGVILQDPSGLQSAFDWAWDTLTVQKRTWLSARSLLVVSGRLPMSCASMSSSSMPRSSTNPSNCYRRGPSSRTERDKDGIQTDGCFFQHGPLIQSGSYGAEFTRDILKLVSLARGTSFRIPSSSVHVLELLVLDGQQVRRR
jgi:hypothetical protein